MAANSPSTTISGFQNNTAVAFGQPIVLSGDGFILFSPGFQSPDGDAL